MNPSSHRRGPLTLLMTDRRARRWAAVGFLLPVFYVLSFGPASWIISRTVTGISVYRIFYRPMDDVARHVHNHWPEVACGVFDVYCDLLVPADRFVDVGVNNSVGPDIYIQGGWPIDVDQAIGLPAAPTTGAVLPVASFILPPPASVAGH